MKYPVWSGAMLVVLVDVTGCQPETEKVEALSETVPAWVADAVFYQIFPERFRNGDPNNDPTHASLDEPHTVPATWQTSPWTADWFVRADWEVAMGDDFYRNGLRRRRYGGDLAGVIEKLDYLKELGINAIYFNPLFYARSLHKYDGNTYHHIDPYFGPDPVGDLEIMATDTADPSTWSWTAADRLFLELLREASSREIRIVIDGVWNHTGRDFFAFADVRKNGPDSPYRDWYIINSFDDPSTPEDEFDHQGWWGYKPLPEFADTPDGTDLHPGPKAYVYDATRRWMDPNGDGDPSDGIAGWRLDVVPDMPVGFWSDWNAYVRTINPDAYTVAEIWHDAASDIRQGG
ncbi:MAG: alpha-amylase family glycosyl hydrolase, partial [Rhodothermales bacterium]|nr:alpha-amylase family glycosyl hydrolase [Rhodothermales bacterium]